MGEILLSICFSGISLVVAVIIYRALKKEFEEHGYNCGKEDKSNEN